VEPPVDDLTATWREVQAQLPPGWTLDGLRCASTGLAIGQRSDDWIAVAVGPQDQQREHRAQDPLGALRGLADSFAR
jgi:hypothetical protein